MECGTLGMFLLACVLLCVMERASTAPAAHRRAAAVAGNSVAAAGAAVALERRTGGEHWFSRGDGENLVKRSAERRLIRKRGKGRRRQKQVCGFVCFFPLSEFSSFCYQLGSVFSLWVSSYLLFLFFVCACCSVWPHLIGNIPDVNRSKNL